MPPDGGCGACGSGAEMGMVLLLSLAFIRNRRRRV
jgi:MYXO-CTERM domain-containing protein